MTSTIKHYSENAQHYFSLYNSVDAENVHAQWLTFLENSTPASALDVGAGSGRDAGWLASKGWHVTAAEPAPHLLELASKNTSTNITWCDASLPDLSSLPSNSNNFDLILLSAVWMHLPEDERPQAIKRLAELLSPNGRMYISLRFGPNDEARPMYPVSYAELNKLASENGLVACNLDPVPSKDGLKRDEVNWVTVELIHEVK